MEFEFISKIALITINETLVAQVFCFLIFMYLLNRVMIRPLKDVMQERENHIESLKKDALDTRHEMEETTADLNRRKSEARLEAFKMKAEIEDKGSQKASEIYIAAHDEIAALKEAAEKETDGQISEARKKIEAESRALAFSIMERILERRIA